jgi:hypothetical protein
VETIKNACRGQLCKLAKLLSATLPVCIVKIKKQLQDLKKDITRHIILIMHDKCRAEKR